MTKLGKEEFKGSSTLHDATKRAGLTRSPPSHGSFEIVKDEQTPRYWGPEG